jgi:HAD superfamily hydrolase (TIGR01509 family)
MSRIVSIVFDFDGVLVDSEPYWEKADARLVEAEGKALDPEAKKAVIGLKQEVSIRMILAMHGIGGDPGVFMRRRERMMEDYYRNDIPLHPGARETLAALERRGLLLAVASSTPKRLVELSLNHHGIRGHFRHVVSAEEVVHGKPAPDVFLLALDRLGVPPAEAVVVEDSMPGILGAKAAGATAVWMRNDHQPEAGPHADGTIGSLSELPSFVERLRCGG